MKERANHILVVEDDAIIALNEQQSLENYGYKVTTVYSGEKAIEAMRNQISVDLILMDINLGKGMDGTETAKCILREMNIPIVFLSSHTDPEIVEKTERITSYGYVVKQSGITVLDASIKMAFRLFEEKERVKTHERSLRDNEALFRGLYDNMTSGSAIYEVLHDGSKGSDYIVKSFNRASLRFENKTLDEVVGKSLMELRPNINDYGLIPVMRQVWATGESTYFPTKIYIDENFSSYYENYIFKLPTGEVVTIYNDVTEQMELKESLVRSENQLRELVDSMEKALAVYEAVDEGSDFIFVDMNKFGETITRYKIAEVLGKRITDLFPAESSIGLIEKLHETWKTGKSTRIPLKQYKDNRITLSVENYIFRLPSGRVVAMFEDTTLSDRSAAE